MQNFTAQTTARAENVNNRTARMLGATENGRPENERPKLFAGRHVSAHVEQKHERPQGTKTTYQKTASQQSATSGDDDVDAAVSAVARVAAASGENAGGERGNVVVVTVSSGGTS